MEIVDLWTLKIEHEYYERKQTTELDVQISTEMRVLLMRRNLVWRRKSISEWCLSSFGDYSLNDEDRLELEVITAGNEVQSVTDFEWPVYRDSYEVKVPIGDGTLKAKECMSKKVGTRTSHSVMKLLVPMGQMINRKIYPSTTTLEFQAFAKYWEYIFLPRRPEMKREIRLGDMRKSIAFGDYENFDFMGHQAQKIRSVEKIPLQERYCNTDLVLWEKVPVGNGTQERILLHAVPCPEPTLNLGTAKDTVWRIIYY